MSCLIIIIVAKLEVSHILAAIATPCFSWFTLDEEHANVEHIYCLQDTEVTHTDAEANKKHNINYGTYGKHKWQNTLRDFRQRAAVK